MTEIKINNAKFFAYHGVLDYEKKYGNEFEVDILMECDLKELGTSDDLSKTVNYLEVYHLAEKIFKANKFHLIETLNQTICNEILENYPAVKSVKVSIRKPNAPLGIIDSVEIVNKIDRKN